MSYSYDPSGQLVSTIDYTETVVSRTYAHDPNDRVIQMATTRQGSDIFNPYT
ncbi:hypothetical protein ACE3MQ_27395 [Paenibacillus lentus]|uniref:hypothetical protein n=1 Tax=Paenibacillus lentus TaxID=1338368 RepID=UPI0036683C19